MAFRDYKNRDYKNRDKTVQKEDWVLVPLNTPRTTGQLNIASAFIATVVIGISCWVLL